MENEPVSDALLDDLAQKFQQRTQWKRLGKALGFQQPVLTELVLDTELPHEPKKARRMLKLWKEERQGNATEETLKNALTKAKLDKLWKEVEGKHSNDAVCTNICIL